MRTTITIDDDVASRLQPLIAKNSGRSKLVINDLLRRALGIQKSKKIQLPVFDLELKPGIDPTAFNKLSEELALEADLDKLRRSAR